jgi:hypothetical protein
MMLRKLDMHMWKTETRSLSLTLHKNQFKMSLKKTLNVKQESLKILEKGIVKYMRI